MRSRCHPAARRQRIPGAHSVRSRAPSARAAVHCLPRSGRFGGVGTFWQRESIRHVDPIGERTRWPARLGKLPVASAEAHTARARAAAGQGRGRPSAQPSRAARSSCWCVAAGDIVESRSTIATVIAIRISNRSRARGVASTRSSRLVQTAQGHEVRSPSPASAPLRARGRLVLRHSRLARPERAASSRRCLSVSMVGETRSKDGPLRPSGQRANVTGWRVKLLQQHLRCKLRLPARSEHDERIQRLLLEPANSSLNALAERHRRLVMLLR